MKESLREILEDYRNAYLNEKEAISAIEAHYNSRRLSEEEIGQILFATQIINTVEISLLSGEDYEDNLNEYIDFSELVLEGKGITQVINYQENIEGLVVDIYFEKEEEYYKDQIVISLGVY